MKPKIHTVILGIEITHQSGREVLSGVFSYIEKKCAPWKTKLIQKEALLTTAELSAMEAEGIDGYLLSFGNTGEARDFLMRSDKPLILMGTEREGFFGRKAPTAFVWNDNAAVGALGARHFESLGVFNSYGFVHSSVNPLCCDARCRGFAEALSESNRNRLHEFRYDYGMTKEEQTLALEVWLEELPKPAAVMTAGDPLAVQVLEASERRRIKVPGQLMVIGINNDELLVSHSSPPLTSVHPGHFEMGFTAAAELDRLISEKKKSKPRATNIPPVRIVERESTKTVKPSVMLVSRAKHYIRRCSAMGITASDVTAYLGCSRELIDLRFRETEGMTLRAAIENFRLNEVKRLLKSTNRPVSTIARQCGFKSASHLSHRFKLRTGMTPGEWKLNSRFAPLS